MIIRPVRVGDAEDVHTIRVMPGVMENILGMASERVSYTDEFIRSLSQDDHVLVAEVEGTVVGIAALQVSARARLRHTAEFGINVRADRQRHGIGKALMSALLDIADNWLKLKRVELSVFTDNEPAIALYRKMGFVVEGTKKYAAVRNGIHADEYLMARYGD
ncbi:MAG: GNAT family N-acetyltransferase [Synergistaceae bacterium]|jgi:putative acetyltransferase|nr:GNAT family N-acetyltransferase [Synergistaceae bacterium]